MLIKMKISVAGTFHGLQGVKRGDVVEVDDVFGARYVALHYAEPVVDRGVECAVLVPEVELRAVPETVVESEPDPVSKPAAPKPGASPARK